MSQERRPAVLVVDDQRAWREFLTELLTDEYDVAQAVNYETAFGAALGQNPPFHACIVDIRLIDSDPQNVDGLHLISALNRLGRFTNTIVVTGYASISTAKRALQKLDAFDYIEKNPADRSGFDPVHFRKLVRSAVEDAEKRRPVPFVRKTNRILVVEPDTKWRNQLLAILLADGYEAEALLSITELEQKLRIQNWGLIVLSSTFLARIPDLLYRITEYEPDAKVIMLTVSEVADAARAVQNREVLNVVELSDRGFDPQEFRFAVRQAFIEANKYVLARFGGIDKEGSLRVDQHCVLSLFLQDVSGSDTLAIAIPPAEMRRAFTLRVSVYVPSMKTQPSDDVTWEIPARAALSLLNWH